MRIMLILDHPYTIESAENVPHRRSFTAAVAAAAMRGARRAGHDVDLVDLVADGFDPVMSREDLVAWRLKTVIDPLVADYQHRLMMADHVVFAFPVWWEAMPASTKGFLDRVLTKGVVFDELAGAKGNPFRNLMPRLGGVTVLSVPAPARPEVCSRSLLVRSGSASDFRPSWGSGGSGCVMQGSCPR